MTSSMNSPDRDKAQLLMHSYARKQGVYDAELDARGDVSFGNFGFRHDEEKGALVGRVFIAKAWMLGDPPEYEDAYRTVARALNNPAVGGLFDQGGGYFRLDEDKRMYFLEKDFPLGKTTPAEVEEGMERLRSLGATWTMRWFARVADVAHGRAFPPAKPVKQGDPDDSY
ncbi:MAG TPA: hypothetical protein PK156_18510 [Polyangium sp.]|nr:hypothetical protein [Polyangium sp.]